jgi:GxxExxY protein
MPYHEEIANDKLTDFIINRAIAIHKGVGPGLSEATYRDLLQEELDEAGMECEAEYEVDICFKGKPVTTGRCDLWVEETVVLELKVVSRIKEEHFQQLGRYVNAAGATRGLVINFGQTTLGLRRYTNFKLEGEESLESAETMRPGGDETWSR